MNKISKYDGISAELFKILKDDTVKLRHSICQQIQKTQQSPQDCKSSVFVSIPKKGNTKKCSNYCTIALLLRESIPRQVDKKSSGPHGERGLEFSRRKKGQTFFPLHSLGLYNNNVSCLRTVSEKTFWLILLSQNVNHGSRSGEVFTTSRHSFDSL